MTKKMYNENTSELYQTRYCAQENFSIAVCMKRRIKRIEYPFCMSSYENSKKICVITKRRYNSKVVACGSNLFVISDSRRYNMFEKYSESCGNKIGLPSILDRRSEFCVCSFMQKVYVIGGYGKMNDISINSCMCYDIKSNKWTYIASMIDCRQNASCAVFEGKIVVTGGYLISNDYNSLCKLKSSESYCFHENKWTQFSDMLQGRHDHSSVTIENKLFVIGGDYKNTCEVLDGITNKFVLIKSLTNLKYESYFLNNIKAVNIGYKIYVYREIQRMNKVGSRSEMFTYCYNKEQNALNQVNDLNFECMVVSCVKMSKQ